MSAACDAPQTLASVNLVDARQNGELPLGTPDCNANIALSLGTYNLQVNETQVGPTLRMRPITVT